MTMWRCLFAAAVLSMSIAACDSSKKPAAGETAAGAKAAAPEEPAAWKAGDKVDVHWGTSWWRAVVVEAASPVSFKVHFVGFTASSDDVVPPSRMRARGAGANIGKAVDEGE